MDISFNNSNLSEFFDSRSNDNHPLAEFKEAMRKPSLPGNFIIDIKHLTERTVREMKNKPIGAGMMKRLVQVTNRLTARKLAFNAIAAADVRSPETEDLLMIQILETLRDLRFLLIKILD